MNMHPKYLIVLILLKITYFLSAQSDITYDSLANIAKTQMAKNTFDNYKKKQ